MLARPRPRTETLTNRHKSNADGLVYDKIISQRDYARSFSYLNARANIKIILHAYINPKNVESIIKWSTIPCWNYLCNFQKPKQFPAEISRFYNECCITSFFSNLRFHLLRNLALDPPPNGKMFIVRMTHIMHIGRYKHLLYYIILYAHILKTSNKQWNTCSRRIFVL